MRYNRGCTAHTNNTTHDDVMSATSNLFKLPISYFKSSLGRLSDATAMIGVRSARETHPMIGVRSARDATTMIGAPHASTLGYTSNIACSSDSMTFEPNLWRDDTTTIGASVTSARAATATIGTFSDPALSHTATVKVVMNFDPKLKRLDHVTSPPPTASPSTARTSTALTASPPSSAPSSLRCPTLRA